MDASRLATLLGPPPDDPVPVDWHAVESWLGLRLPADYKVLATAYGPLDIGDHLWLHTPCAQDGRFDYGTWLRTTHRQCRIASRDAPPNDPPPFHPAPGGLLAFGMTRSGSHLFWDTGACADPDRWPVVLFHEDAADRRVNPWQGYGTGLFDTLATALRTGLPLPGGGTLGPLPPTARRTAFLPGPAPWRPPVPAVEAVPVERRRAAVTEGSGLAALRLLTPPPAQPYLGAGAWPALFAQLGTRLPIDYIALLERYGAGCWMGWLRFLTPLRPPDAGFVRHIARTLSAYRTLRDAAPGCFPLPLWPAPGGFLPCANTIDGDQLGWLTRGAPDDWPVIVWPRHAGQGPPLPGTLTDVLLAWLRGQLSTEGLPGLDRDDDPLEFAVFEPSSDDGYW
ncbi:SMI1/KNR4 family protein [Streptomyces litchfieldiae]|uniref:SMI1/KNR4 family protein n=1 Tax=Streptomyces litchfieldiae TaxID=3075543 RepID=A0ABU2MM37_9ACTN|nr:SMI1/KNR4 family protein [Streptomyces sp. DSM 44938]MDT0342610.1 SMI1/KNR4 family protein [Streptomyces sp. DSM 44938]